MISTAVVNHVLSSPVPTVITYLHTMTWQNSCSDILLLFLPLECEVLLV